MLFAAMTGANADMDAAEFKDTTFVRSVPTRVASKLVGEFGNKEEAGNVNVEDVEADAGDDEGTGINGFDFAFRRRDAAAEAEFKAPTEALAWTPAGTGFGCGVCWCG